MILPGMYKLITECILSVLLRYNEACNLVCNLGICHIKDVPRRFRLEIPRSLTNESKLC